MNKIITKAERERKQKRNQLILGIFLIFTMILSTFGYAFFYNSDSEQQKIEYNKIKFTNSEYGTWLFKVNNLNFETLYNPLEVINISLQLSEQDYQGQKLYFTSDLESSSQNAQLEISKNLGYLTTGIDFACLDESCELDKPIKNCSDSNIIVFNADNNINEPIITQEQNCLIINSSYADQEKIADAIVFRVLGII